MLHASVILSSAVITLKDYNRSRQTQHDVIKRLVFECTKVHDCSVYLRGDDDLMLDLVLRLITQIKA